MMQAPVDTKLTSFNTLALRYQDEVFTLAYYLLGDEASAAKAAQTAFEAVFRRIGKMQKDSFRFEVLRSVLEKCRQAKGMYLARKPSLTEHRKTDFQTTVFRRLMHLPREECETAVLVDILGLSYEEAGRVLGCSTKEIGHLVALARFNLSQETARQH
jgi:DNA-directed RNA polymerase specialized sigma24 family protein